MEEVDQWLLESVCKKDITAVISALANGADPNSADLDRWRWTALHYAVANNDNAIVDLLLANGANTEAFDAALGRSPLHYACEQGFAQTVKRLLKSCSDINRQDKGGETALHCAAMCGNEDVVAILLKNGANVGVADCTGSTPLHTAAEYGHLAAVKILVSAGGNCIARDSDGNTPAQLAKFAGFDDICRQLSKASRSMRPVLGKYTKRRATTPGHLIDPGSERK